MAKELRQGKNVLPIRNEPGLKFLLRYAIDQGWIKDEGFEWNPREAVLTEDGIDYVPIPPERAQRPTEAVLENLPDLRNSMAHGQPTWR